MYINFTDIVNKWGKPKGVIHIGAHLLEEREEYIKNGFTNTIWVEANPRIYQEILKQTLYVDEMVLNHCISDKDDEKYTFHITNNGQSSSILELDVHLHHHPHIQVVDHIEVYSKRMDSIINHYGIDIYKYDFLNLDIQGAELLALKSFGNLISNFNFIYTEVNTNSLYKDCALMSDIDIYLSQYGFSRVETVMTEAEWGDALYVKGVKNNNININMEKKLIFDIGSHNGLFTDKCLEFYPDSKVVSIEANENLWGQLHVKYSGNRRVCAINYLVSEITGQFQPFYICDADQISTASVDWIENSRFNNFNYNQVLHPLTVNIDSLIKIFGKPDLIKIDVEGFEYEVVKGLSQKVGEICFEWAEEEYDKINKTCQHLIELGYNNFGWILGDEFLKRPENFTNWQDSDFHQIVKPEDKNKWGMIWVN